MHKVEPRRHLCEASSIHDTATTQGDYYITAPGLLLDFVRMESLRVTTWPSICAICCAVMPHLHLPEVRYATDDSVDEHLCHGGDGGGNNGGAGQLPGKPARPAGLVGLVPHQEPEQRIRMAADGAPSLDSHLRRYSTVLGV